MKVTIMQLASSFGRNATVLRSPLPLSDEQIVAVAPSIFARHKHTSCSDRYTYIPTIDLLRGLRAEGFLPFMVCQTRSRDGSKRAHAKHMLRLRHASQIDGDEANEIILLNSHDGTSSYQMLAGAFRYVCQNGMVCGATISDVRVRHQGDIVGDVIDGAFRVLDYFEQINGQKDGMKALTLNAGEQAAFARAAQSRASTPKSNSTARYGYSQRNCANLKRNAARRPPTGGWLKRVCRAWHVTMQAEVLQPGVRRSEGQGNGKGVIGRRPNATYGLRRPAS
jgi:hypothetical protein